MAQGKRAPKALRSAASKTSLKTSHKTSRAKAGSKAGDRPASGKAVKPKSVGDIDAGGVPDIAPMASASPAVNAAQDPMHESHVHQGLLPFAQQIDALVQNQIVAVDRVLKMLLADEGGDPERKARAMASLARTLRELAAHVRDSAPEEGATEDDIDDDDPIPRDIDEFRRELTRRIADFVREQPDDGVSHPATPEMGGALRP